jgi:thiosulfate reductase cytochrome b subunit
VDAMIKYYLTGIFTDAPHPFKQTRVSKHNPLQRLAYLFVLVVINPIIWTTGWFYLFYNSWRDWGVGWLSLEWVALFHVIAAFMMLLFVIAHVYLTTAGATPLSHIKAMITGWEETH